MPMLNYKPRFVPMIRAGTKRHTIRADRKVPVKKGDKLYHYCGARTKNCFAILPGPYYTICTKVLPIIIRDCTLCGGSGELCHSSTHYTPCPVFEIIIDGALLSRDECERLARADGFENFAEMMQFWDGRRPFRGQIIHW